LDRLPAQETGEQREQRLRRRQRGARGFDIAFEADDLPLQLAVLPEAERIAVGVEDVRQRLELAPLLPVVLVRKPARIGTLARRLDLDEADQGVVDADRVVGTRREVRK
jgi:hypothetical protein